MKDFLKKLFGKGDGATEQPEMGNPAEETPSTDEQSEKKTT